jgi:hypothetical protein
VTVPVTITNTGVQPEDYFLDPRLNGTTSMTLAPFDQATGLALPLTVALPPYWLVPTQTSSVDAAASSSLPTVFDFGSFAGDPDLPSSAFGSASLCSTAPTGTYAPAGGSVTTGFWFVEPSECGPYSSAAPAGTVSAAMTVYTKPFDTSMTSPTDDLWQAATNPAATFSPVIINPGDSATVDVTITPSGPRGTVVSGNLYVDDFISGLPVYGQLSGDELAAIPYAYRIR